MGLGIMSQRARDLPAIDVTDRRPGGVLDWQAAKLAGLYGDAPPEPALGRSRRVYILPKRTVLFESSADLAARTLRMRSGLREGDSVNFVLIIARRGRDNPKKDA
jgi:hypothetical protein